MESGGGRRRMKRRGKHWWEYGRVTNSDWFRNLPDSEKECVLLALEHDTHESAAKFRATLTFAYMTVLWAIAFGLWGMAFNFAPDWFAAGGAALGAVISLLSWTTIASQGTPRGAKDMQFVAGATFGNFGIIIGGVGLIAWVIRAIFFR
jgi:hypothetical protein